MDRRPAEIRLVAAQIRRWQPRLHLSDGRSILTGNEQGGQIAPNPSCPCITTGGSRREDDLQRNKPHISVAKLKSSAY